VIEIRQGDALDAKALKVALAAYYQAVTGGRHKHASGPPSSRICASSPPAGWPARSTRPLRRCPGSYLAGIRRERRERWIGSIAMAGLMALGLIALWTAKAMAQPYSQCRPASIVADLLAEKYHAEHSRLVLSRAAGQASRAAVARCLRIPEVSILVGHR
jgi:hypothetical protein